jgi:hypothetical protein
MLIARFAAMVMRRVHLTDSDLKVAERACRGLAVRYREDAARQANPAMRGIFEKSAMTATD